jgi:hypothetical protein
VISHKQLMILTRLLKEYRILLKGTQQNLTEDVRIIFDSEIQTDICNQKDRKPKDRQ